MVPLSLELSDGLHLACRPFQFSIDTVWVEKAKLSRAHPSLLRPVSGPGCDEPVFIMCETQSLLTFYWLRLCWRRTRLLIYRGRFYNGSRGNQLTAHVHDTYWLSGVQNVRVAGPASFVMVGVRRVSASVGISILSCWIIHHVIETKSCVKQNSHKHAERRRRRLRCSPSTPWLLSAKRVSQQFAPPPEVTMMGSEFANRGSSVAGGRLTDNEKEAAV